MWIIIAQKRMLVKNLDNTFLEKLLKNFYLVEILVWLEGFLATETGYYIVFIYPR